MSLSDFELKPQCQPEVSTSQSDQFQRSVNNNVTALIASSHKSWPGKFNWSNQSLTWLKSQQLKVFI